VGGQKRKANDAGFPKYDYASVELSVLTIASSLKVNAPGVHPTAYNI
jgi:hypothetical protein